MITGTDLQLNTFTMKLLRTVDTKIPFYFFQASFETNKKFRCSTHRFGLQHRENLRCSKAISTDWHDERLSQLFNHVFGMCFSFSNFVLLSVLYFKLHFQQDLQTIDLDEFKYSGTNITAFRLVDPENPLVYKTVSEWSQSELRSDKKPNERVFQVNSQFSSFYVFLSVTYLLRDISFLSYTNVYIYKIYFSFLFFIIAK